MKRDRFGDRLNRAGGCNGRDLHEEGPLIRVWFQPDKVAEKEAWVRKVDIVRFDYQYPGSWGSQSLAENLRLIQAGASEWLEKLAPPRESEPTARQTAYSVRAPFAETWLALTRALQQKGLAALEEDRSIGLLVTRPAGDFPQSSVACGEGTGAGKPQMSLVAVVKRVEDESLLKLLVVFAGGDPGCRSTGILEKEIGEFVQQTARR